MFQSLLRLHNSRRGVSSWWRSMASPSQPIVSTMENSCTQKSLGIRSSTSTTMKEAEDRPLPLMTGIQENQNGLHVYGSFAVEDYLFLKKNIAYQRIKIKLSASALDIRPWRIGGTTDAKGLLPDNIPSMYSKTYERLILRSTLLDGLFDKWLF